MTYIPAINSQVDNANSTSGTLSSFAGSSVITTGYNKIIVTITSTVNSVAGGLEIKFSDDNSTFTTFNTDTYFTGVAFSKDFPILKKYYKISYTGSSSAVTTITTRLSTDSNEEKDDSMMDAFNKLRVSMPFTLLDIKYPLNGTSEILNNKMIICNDSSGSYSASVTTDTAKCNISGSGIGYYINQSRKYCSYQPGKSLLFLASGILNANNNTSIISRIGYFDSNNGLFFQYNGTGMSVVLRNNTNDTAINQSDWNIDKMNGTGSSGINLDFTKAQLFVIDFEWLSVGRVRFGFYVMGKINYCHQIINLNNLTGPYMLNPNLPIRFELRGSSSGSSGSLTQICATVISEGGFLPLGKPFGIGTGNTATSILTSETPILAIKANETYYNHQNILPTNLNLICSGANDIILYKVRLYLGGNSIGTTTWNNVDPNSLVQYALKNNITGFTTTDSIILDEGYIVGKGTVTLNTLSNSFNNFFDLASNVNNVSDIIVITAQGCGGNANSYCSLTWQEIY